MKTFVAKKHVLLHVVLVALACALACAPAQAFAEGYTPANSELLELTASSSTTLQAGVKEFKKGNVVLTLTPEEMLAIFAHGDIVNVSFGETTLELPLVISYSDVDSGLAGLFVRPEKGTCVLAINMGDFEAVYGIEADTVFTFSLKEAAGYLDELTMRQLAISYERSDYADLTDAEFANFRAVNTTGMGEGVLYRSSSPVNPKNHRNVYADIAARDAGVTVILNLADDTETAVAYEGYAESYYATTQHIEVTMTFDYASEDFQKKLVCGLRFMIDNPGTYLIHCTEGKDRTGFVCALLECLMGASYDEIVSDYMLTYTNYYGITADDARYERIARTNIEQTLQRTFGIEDLASADLAEAAETYLAEIGLTADEIAAVKFNLAGEQEVVDPVPDDVTDPEAQGQTQGETKDEPQPQTEPTAAPTQQTKPASTQTLPQTGDATQSGVAVCLTVCGAAALVLGWRTKRGCSAA